MLPTLSRRLIILATRIQCLALVREKVGLIIEALLRPCRSRMQTYHLGLELGMPPTLSHETLST
jgi:hypothetical protein